MKRLIILVLILLFSVPILTRTTYQATDTNYEFGLWFINTLDPKTEAFNFACEKLIEEDSDTIMAFAFYDFYFLKDEFDHYKYWPTEFTIQKVEGIDGALYVSIQGDVKQEAGLSIGWTLLISIILLIGALMFTNQTNNMVVKPIVEMIDTVKKITENPLASS